MTHASTDRRMQNRLLTMIGNTPFAISVAAKGVLMRALCTGVVFAMALGTAAGAQANDYSILNGPVLRGADHRPASLPDYPTTSLSMRWDGLYAGGQFGRTMGGFNYGNGVTSLVDYILRNTLVLGHVRDWTTLPKDDTTSTSYGGFIGYNVMFDDAVVGAEINYNRLNMNSGAADSISRIFQDDSLAPAGHHFFYATTIDGSATVRVTDVATVRARAAFAYDRFLPYAFLGLAIGRADVKRTATVEYTRTDFPDVTDPVTPPIAPVNFGPVTRTEDSKGVFTYGYTAGLGIDILVTPYIFVRGEWEYIQFTSFKDVDVKFNTVRAAVGVKF